MKKEQSVQADDKTNKKNFIVNHDEIANEFFVDLDSINLGDERAVLKYRIDDESSVDFYKTFVPRLARGRGIAEALVDAGLAWATEKNYKQHASCWYVQKSLSA